MIRAFIIDRVIGAPEGTVPEQRSQQVYISRERSMAGISRNDKLVAPVTEYSERGEVETEEGDQIMSGDDCAITEKMEAE